MNGTEKKTIFQLCGDKHVRFILFILYAVQRCYYASDICIFISEYKINIELKMEGKPTFNIFICFFSLFGLCVYCICRHCAIRSFQLIAHVCGIGNQPQWAQQRLWLLYFPFRFHYVWNFPLSCHFTPPISPNSKSIFHRNSTVFTFRGWIKD